MIVAGIYQTAADSEQQQGSYEDSMAVVMDIYCPDAVYYVLTLVIAVVAAVVVAVVSLVVLSFLLLLKML